MYIGNLKPADELNSLIIQALRNVGIKYRPKKNNSGRSNHDCRQAYKDTRVFKRPLSGLRTQLVALKSGPTVEVPQFVAEACNHIRSRCDVEGIFRKAGSAARLREIKAFVDNGKQFEPHHHVVDVSNILKFFFRELPEPLLPFSFHDLLLRCLLLKERAIDGILLTCLLFPLIHINTLAYLMEFFQEVASYEVINKMGISNLAIILTPSLMPVEEKVVINSSTRLGHHVRVIELLMKNTERIGMLPGYLAEKAINIGCGGSVTDETDGNENDASKSKKKKKRRSGSLTRMINGLKKMVGKGSPDTSDQPITSTPDFSSPCVKSSKKRKLHESTGAFSSKKKREILQSLPQREALANAPHTPLKGAVRELQYSPEVNLHPKLTAAKSESRLRSRLHVGRKSGKKSKKEASTDTDMRSPDTSRRSDRAPRSSLDWQWKVGPWRRKKCLSSSDTPVFTGDLAADNRSTDSVLCSDSASGTASLFDHGVDLSYSTTSSESEFVKIPKSEYEEIKNRVSAIENRISQEFECIISDPNSFEDIPLIDESDDEMCSATKVQNAYQKTLEESEKICDPVSTDQLAKRLSRELKIRHSLENKIIRSPSARKIGTIRRRSRENARSSLGKISKNNSPKCVVRHSSLRQELSHVCNQEQILYPKSNLRRGRPNTVFSGLPHPSPRIPSSSSDQTSKFNLMSDQQSLESKVMNLPETFAKPVMFINNTPRNKRSQQKDDKSFKTPNNRNRGNGMDHAAENNMVRRASSFHGTDVIVNQECNVNSFDLKKSSSQIDITCRTPLNKSKFLASSVSDVSNLENWENAPQFFKKPDLHDIPVSGRESVVKIRSQNAGMVLARMRLFDKKRDPDGTPSRVQHLQSGYHQYKLEPKSTKTNTPQSLRVQCIQDNFWDKNNFQIVSVAGERRRSIRLQSASCDSIRKSPGSKGSPKKIGSPRKKYLSQKSPKALNKKVRTKSSKSPQKDVRRGPHSGNERNLRKFNSLRETSNRSPFTSKGNVTAPPSILDLGKENLTPTNSYELCTLTKPSNECSDKKSEILQHIHIPDNLKETIYDVCTPKMEKFCKMSASPLKDCNRIDVNTGSQLENNRPTLYKTPKSTPFIKKPLLIKSPSNFSRTPYRTPAGDSHSRLNTPLKAVPLTTSNTPVVPSRSSPRFIASRNVMKS